MPRLFVGVPAPADLDTSGVRTTLEDRASGVKPVDPELYHVTVAFLGDTPRGEVGPIADAVREGAQGLGPHEGTARGLGAFPDPSRASVVWVGVDGTRLTPLAEGVREALDARGIGYDDRHDFHPHVTVARLRDEEDLTTLTQPHERTDFGAFPVDRVVLYESNLTPDGPEYEALETVRLGADA
jgi:2'-5' RNA ligase